MSSVVLADFGIAHFSEDVLLSAVETDNQERLANFSYAAPEQRVRGAKVGASTDIWALGLILNELFTGKLILGKGHELIASVAPDYVEFDDLIELMLRQSLEERPAIGSIKPHFAPVPAAATNAETETDALIKPESITSDELLQFAVEYLASYRAAPVLARLDIRRDEPPHEEYQGLYVLPDRYPKLRRIFE